MVSKYRHLSMSQLIGISLLLLTTLGCESSTKYSNKWTSTIVVNDREFRLHLLNPDTGETVVIREWPKVYNPRWSPDAMFIAYSGASSSGRGGYQIYVTDRFGRENEIITLWERDGNLEESWLYAENPVWSPDGNFIAFSWYADIPAIPYIVIATSNPSMGLNYTLLTTDNFDNVPYDWTPDGTKILFRSNGLPDGTIDSDGRNDIYLINIDGTSKYRVIESDSSFNARYARFSPNGNMIAFIAASNGGQNSGAARTDAIYTCNADGSNITRVIGMGITGTGFIKAISLSWSPDGTRLTYSAGEKPQEGGHVFIVNLDGTNNIQITHGKPIYDDLDWRP